MRQLLSRGAQGHFCAQTLLRLFAEEGQERVIKRPPLPSAQLFSGKKKKKSETPPAKISFLWKLWLGRAPWACETKWAGRQPLSCVAGSRRPQKQGTRLSWMTRCAGRAAALAAMGLQLLVSSLLPPLPSLLLPDLTQLQY